MALTPNVDAAAHAVEATSRVVGTAPRDSLQVSRPDPDAALCATVSTPFPETIQPEELAAALLSAASAVGESAERWAPHLERLFAETPAPMVIRFYDRHPGELGDLAAAYRWHVTRRGIRNPRLEAYLGGRG